MPLLPPHTYVQSWYPLCASGAVKRGAPLAVSAFGTRWAVFRDGQGRPAALHAVCRHMGADLAGGKVGADGYLRCPYHGWAFDPSGACASTPCGEPAPAASHQRALPCQEAGGLIYAFLGPSPRYDLPTPRGFTPAVVSGVAMIDLDAPIDVAGVNLFDMQHLESIHHRVLLAPPIFTFEGHCARAMIRARVAGDTLHDRTLRLFGIREAGINADCWGGNDIFFYYPRFDLCARMGFLPLDPGRCRMFLSVMGGPRWGSGLLARAAVEAHLRWVLLFLRDDFTAVHRCTFDVKALLPVADASVRQWLAYYASLPTLDLSTLCAATTPDRSSQRVPIR